MSQLVSESRIIRMPLGDILEVTFRGIHDWTHGREMARYVEAKLRETHPVAVLFNLLDYEYVFGNDVTILFSASFDREGNNNRMRPICIVATGTTHRSLHGWFKGAHLLDGGFKIEFALSAEAALQRLEERLAQDPA